LLNSKKGALLLNSLLTILKAPTIYHVRIGAIWVVERDKDQKGNKEPSRTKTLICPFVELEQKLRNLWNQALAQNKRYWLLRNLVRDGAKQISSKWGLLISISECSIDEK
jgi:hypothetical protein